MAENSWHRYDMKKLRHCHPIYCKPFQTQTNAHPRTQMSNISISASIYPLCCNLAYNNKKRIIMRWDSERELFYDYIFNHFYAVCPGSYRIRRSSMGTPLSASGKLTQEGQPNIAILGLSKAIYRKQCKIGGKLVLITNRKSYMSFRLV